MFKISVFQIDAFLQTVNECTGAVYLFLPGGYKENIRHDYYTQEALRQRHKENHSFLRLSLDIPCPNDYQKIVFFSLSDR